MAWYDDLAGFWDDWGDDILQVGGSLASAALANQGQNAAARAANAGSQAAVDLNRDIYNRNIGLSTPGYIQGGDAANKLAAIHGIAPQDYRAAISGNAFNTGTGAYSPAQWGASNGTGGGGGGNAFARGIGSGIGTAVGSIFGPVGGFVGGAIGDMAGGLFNDKPNWKERGATLGTAAPAGYGYDEYFNSQPGFATEWAKPDVQRLFGGNRDAYLWWHANGGVTDGKQSWAPQQEWLDRGRAATTGGGTSTPSGSTGGGTGNAFAATDPMQDFWNSGYGKLAVSGFRNLDTPEIMGSAATGGQALSGATRKALDDRGRARSQNAFGTYTDSLRSMAGQVPIATGQIANAGSNFGATAGNAFVNQGNVNANAAQTRNNNWRTFMKDAGSVFY